MILNLSISTMMNLKTFNKCYLSLSSELHRHERCEEILQLMDEQLMDDSAVIVPEELPLFPDVA